MRSPRRVCSSGSSHTAHSLPTKVRSRRVRLRSVSSMPVMAPRENVVVDLFARALLLLVLLLFSDGLVSSDADLRGRSAGAVLAVTEVSGDEQFF